MGYRYYDTKKIKTQYPFGHGLSYTTFSYGPLQVDADVFEEEKKIIGNEIKEGFAKIKKE